MVPDRDQRDMQRHRNLVRIGRVIDLPTADAARRARWQETAPAMDAHTKTKGHGIMQRHRRLALATTSLAAAIVLALCLPIGQTARVSAAQIFQGFATALSRSVAIEIEELDFGDVQIDGQILIDRSAAATGETRYAEVHVLLRSENPEWNDLDAVLAMFATPTDAWQFCRGNGGWVAGTPEVHPTSHLNTGFAWDAFAAQPLAGFGSMPSALEFSVDGDTTRYRFTREQRVVTEALLGFLLELSTPGTAEQVVRDLHAAARDVTVESVDANTHILRASGFARLGEFELVAPVAPDVAELVRKTKWKLAYDPTTGAVRSWSTRPPPELYDTGVGLVVDPEALDLPWQDAEALVAAFEARAVDVKVDERSATAWDIIVAGYPFETSTAGLDWLAAYLAGLQESLTLEVVYDAPTASVQSAVLRGFGGADGCVRLRCGPVQIDPAWRDPGRWVTPETMRY
jgi:hypothetical protein